MKKQLIFTLLIVVAGLTFGQPGDSFKAIEPFNTIQIYDGIDVILERGDNYYLCPGSATKLEDLSITFENNTLKLRKISGIKYDKTPSMKVIYNKLAVIEGYSKANISTQNLIKDDSVKVILKSGATFYGSFDIKYLEADVIEGCLFKAEGYATIQKIDVATKATFAGFTLEGVEAEVKAGTGGKAKINVEKKLTATATSGGFINYKGDPAVFEKATLGGKIVHDTEE